MTKYPMTKETRMTNDELALNHVVICGRSSCLPIRHSSLVILSSLGISSFVIPFLPFHNRPLRRQCLGY
jgi:hypothetical protein